MIMVWSVEIFKLFKHLRVDWLPCSSIAHPFFSFSSSIGIFQISKSKKQIILLVIHFPSIGHLDTMMNNTHICVCVCFSIVFDSRFHACVSHSVCYICSSLFSCSVHRSKLQMKMTVDDQHKTLSFNKLPMYSPENIEGKSQTRISSCINLYFNHHQHHSQALENCSSTTFELESSSPLNRDTLHWWLVDT